MLVMKRIILATFLLILTSSIFSQNIFIGNPVKQFRVYPVDDSEVEAIGINGGLKNVAPYDFYAALGCEVKQPLDTVILAEGYNFKMTVECTAPCFIITYGRYPSGGDSDMRVFWIKKRDADRVYRDTIEFNNDINNFMRRVIVVNAKYALKKVVSDYFNPDPGFPMTSVEASGDGLNSSLINWPITNTNHCSIDFEDLDFNRSVHVEGDVTGNNMYLLHGTASSTSSTQYYDAQLPSEPYAIFTTSSTTDVELFVMNNNNEIVAHCNDYSVASDHDWGTEARVDLSGNDSLKAIILVPYQSYLEHETDYFLGGENYVFPEGAPEGVANLYIGCKYYDFASDDGAFFPNLRTNDALLSDGSRSSGLGWAYSSYAWSLKEYTYYSNFNSIGNGSASSIVHNYILKGYTTDGATEENSEIDLWEYRGMCTNASVKSGTNGYSYGYAWESKNGLFGDRFMHPRYALTNDDPSYAGSEVVPFGHVVIHLRKDPNYENLDFVYENIDFSQEDIDVINNTVKSLSRRELDDIIDDYSHVEAAVRKSHINNPALFKMCLTSYKDMLKKSQTSMGARIFLMQKLSEGDILAAYLLLDMKLADSEADMKMAKFDLTERLVDESKQRVFRPDLSEATLYAKALLEEVGVGVEAEKKMIGENVSYSDQEDSFSVKTERNRIDVEFTLTRESNVSLIVSRHDGLYSKCLSDQNKMESGSHILGAELAEKGLYTVTLIVNGHIYNKKVSVR